MDPRIASVLEDEPPKQNKVFVRESITEEMDPSGKVTFFEDTIEEVDDIASPYASKPAGGLSAGSAAGSGRRVRVSGRSSSPRELSDLDPTLIGEMQQALAEAEQAMAEE